jgi:Mg-chelatase subunit ChlD
VTQEEGGTTFYGITTHSQRVLFVLDFSGSMNFPASEGESAKKKIDVLREEFRRATTGLPDGSSFGVVGFSADVRVWKKEPAKREAKTAADAVKWVDGQEVVGGTNIYDALERAFQLASSKDPKGEPVFDTMYFMTDGTPSVGKITNTEQIRAEVRRWNLSKRVRMHVIGMGGHHKPKPGEPKSDIDERFLRQLAEDNGGQCVIR